MGGAMRPAVLVHAHASRRSSTSWIWTPLEKPYSTFNAAVEFPTPDSTPHPDIIKFIDMVYPCLQYDAAFFA